MICVQFGLCRNYIEKEIHWMNLSASWIKTCILCMPRQEGKDMTFGMYHRGRHNEGI